MIRPRANTDTSWVERCGVGAAGDASSDKLPACARCSRRGTKGATLQAPGWADRTCG